MQRKREQLSSSLVPRQLWRRFQWRLTLLYMISSIVTLVVIQAVLGVILIYLYVYSPALAEDTAEEMKQVAPKVAQFFDKDKVDTGGLTRWLDQQRFEESFPGSAVSAPLENTDKTSIVIARLDGVIIASTPDSSSFAPGAQLDRLCTEEERNLLNLARAGAIRTKRSQGRILGAGMLQKDGKEIALGFVRTGEHYTLRNGLIGTSSSLFFNIILTAFGGAIIGGVFGFLTARSVNRRLLGIASAAECWAFGDLKVSAPEEPADEIGLLGKRLNGMVADLEQVISLRRRVAALEERQKITRDLHDTVKQQAFATSLMVVSAQERLDAGDMAGVRETLNQAEMLSHRMQEELRNILKEIRAAHSLPLIEALERMTTEWTRQTHISLHLKIAPEADSFTPAMSEEIVRIVQEALANIAKHSQASRADVILARDAEGWNLTVADNGCGIAEGQGFGEGLGLQTMRERAGELPEGNFALTVTPEGGTCIDVTFQEMR